VTISGLTKQDTEIIETQYNGTVVPDEQFDMDVNGVNKPQPR